MGPSLHFCERNRAARPCALPLNPRVRSAHSLAGYTEGFMPARTMFSTYTVGGTAAQRQIAARRGHNVKYEILLRRIDWSPLVWSLPLDFLIRVIRISRIPANLRVIIADDALAEPVRELLLEPQFELKCGVPEANEPLRRARRLLSELHSQLRERRIDAVRGEHPHGLHLADAWSSTANGEQTATPTKSSLS